MVNLFDIDSSSTVAPFEQVRVNIVDAARSGRLPPGSKLPTVRQLAADLGIAANTVAKSYRLLESDGVIETRGRSGSFVAATGDVTARLAYAAALDFARRMQQLDVGLEEALALVRTAYPALSRAE